MANMNFEDKFDKLIHDQLAGYEQAPGESAWNKLDGVLSENRANKSAMRKLNNFSAAVSLSAVLFCGIAILKNKESVAPVSNTADVKTEEVQAKPNQETVVTTVVVAAEEKPEVIEIENEVIENNNVARLPDGEVVENTAETEATPTATVDDVDATDVAETQATTENTEATPAAEVTISKEIEATAAEDDDKSLLEHYSNESKEKNPLFKEKE